MRSVPVMGPAKTRPLSSERIPQLCCAAADSLKERTCRHYARNDSRNESPRSGPQLAKAREIAEIGRVREPGHNRRGAEVLRRDCVAKARQVADAVKQQRHDDCPSGNGRRRSSAVTVLVGLGRQVAPIFLQGHGRQGRHPDARRRTVGRRRRAQWCCRRRPGVQQTPSLWVRWPPATRCALVACDAGQHFGLHGQARPSRSSPSTNCSGGVSIE